MNLWQWLKALWNAGETYESGQPVPVQFDDWAPENGLKLAFTPGNVNLTIPSGEVFAIPFANLTLNLPFLGPTLISAGAKSIIFQKKAG